MKISEFESLDNPELSDVVLILDTSNSIAPILRKTTLSSLFSLLGNGEQGMPGIQGEKGDTGEQGIPGIQGEKGDTGEQGIPGIQGEKGDTGEQGIPGIQGEKGDTGEQGIPGIQGLKGEQGAAGTFTIPSTTKSSAASTDFFIGIDGTDTIYRISKSNLLAGLGGGASTSPTALTYGSAGDAAGLFYFLGRQRNTVAWANPQNNGLVITASSVENGALQDLSDRQEGGFNTADLANSWVQFYISTGKLTCNYYSLRSRFYESYYPRSWKLQGSNNGTTWVDLNTQTNNTTLNTTNKWLAIAVSGSTAYSYFRILQTGVNSVAGSYYLCLGEVELYGTYSP